MKSLGWIKLQREITDSPIWVNEIALKIYVWIKLKAHHSDDPLYFGMKTGKGKTTVRILKNQFIYGRKKAAEELGIPESTVYRWMTKFDKEYNIIRIENRTHYSIITLIEEETSAKVGKSEQPINDLSITTPNTINRKSEKSEQPMNYPMNYPMNTYKTDNNGNNGNNLETLDLSTQGGPKTDTIVEETSTGISAVASSQRIPISQGDNVEIYLSDDLDIPPIDFTIDDLNEFGL